MADDTPLDALLGMPNGAEYVCLYLKLCLMTANKSGRLCAQFGEMIIPYDVEKIAKDMKHFSVDTVRVAMEIYKKMGLIYTEEDGVLAITGASEMVGSEYPSAARMREKRDRDSQKQIASHCDTNVTEKCVTSKKQSDIEIRDKSIEYRVKSKDIDKEQDTIDFGNNKVLPNNKDNDYINSLSPHAAERESEKDIKIPPDIEDVKAYIKEKGYDIDAEEWWYFYDSKGWKIGKEKMKKWKSAVNTWYFARKNKAQSPLKQETWAEQQRRLHEKFAREDEENAKRNEQRGN